MPSIAVREDRGRAYNLLFIHDGHNVDNSNLLACVDGLAAHLPLKHPTTLAKQNDEFYLAWLFSTHVS